MKQFDMNVFKNDILNTVRSMIIILDSDLKLIYANNSFYDTFKVTHNSIENILIYELGNGQWNIPELRSLLEKVLPKNIAFNDFKVSHVFPNIGQKTMLINAKQLKDGTRPDKFIFISIDDITEQDKIESLKLSQSVLESKYAELEKFHLLTIDRELKMIELKKEIKELKKNK